MSYNEDAEGILPETDDIPEEIDVPLPDAEFKQDDSVTVSDNKRKKDWFNLVKGHKLLGICVALIFIMYLLDFFFNGKKNAEQVLEIFKVLLFTLSGYLYGKRE